MVSRFLSPKWLAWCVKGLSTRVPNTKCDCTFNEHFQNFERPKWWTCISQSNMKQWSMFFLGSILICSQSGYDWQEDFARFGYNLNMKVKLKKYPFVVLATNFEQSKKNLAIFFSKIWLNSGYWKSLKSHMLLAFKICCIASWV